MKLVIEPFLFNHNNKQRGDPSAHPIFVTNTERSFNFHPLWARNASHSTQVGWGLATHVISRSHLYLIDNRLCVIESIFIYLLPSSDLSTSLFTNDQTAKNYWHFSVHSLDTSKWVRFKKTARWAEQLDTFSWVREEIRDIAVMWGRGGGRNSARFHNFVTRSTKCARTSFVNLRTCVLWKIIARDYTKQIGIHFNKIPPYSIPLPLLQSIDEEKRLWNRRCLLCSENVNDL